MTINLVNRAAISKLSTWDTVHFQSSCYQYTYILSYTYNQLGTKPYRRSMGVFCLSFASRSCVTALLLSQLPFSFLRNQKRDPLQPAEPSETPSNSTLCQILFLRTPIVVDLVSERECFPQVIEQGWIAKLDIATSCQRFSEARFSQRVASEPPAWMAVDKPRVPAVGDSGGTDTQ